MENLQQEKLKEKVSLTKKVLKFLKKKIAVLSAAICAGGAMIWWLKETNIIVPYCSGSFEITTSMGEKHIIKSKNFNDLISKYQKLDDESIVATLPKYLNSELYEAFNYSQTKIADGSSLILTNQEYIDVINNAVNYYPNVIFLDEEVMNPEMGEYRTIGIHESETNTVYISKTFKGEELKGLDFATVYLHECFHGKLTSVGKAVEKSAILLKDKLYFEESERFNELSAWNFISSTENENLKLLKYKMLESNWAASENYNILGKIIKDLLDEKNSLAM